MIWLILILAFFLRVINLDQSFWLDEGTQAILSSQSLFSTWFGRAADFHPPLSYILTHFWILGGTSEVWLRLLPVIFGVATVWVVFLLARDFSSERIANISAFFMAIAPYHIYYSQELRMYSMATLFAVLSMLFFWRIFSENKWWVAGYLISTALLLYTHYLGALLIMVQVIWLIVKRKLFKFLGLYFLIFLLYLPWVPQFIKQLQGGLAAEEYLPGWSNVLSLPKLTAIPLTFIKFSIGRIDFENIIIYGVIAIVVFLFYGFIFLKVLPQLRKNSEVQLLILWLTVPIVLAIIISGVIPLNQPFRLLFVLPAFYLLLSYSVGQAGRWMKPLLLGVTLVSLAGLTIYYTQPRFWREDWREAVSYIKQQPLKDSVILFEFPEPFASYQWYDKGETPASGVVKKFPAQKDYVTNQLNNVMERKDTAYLFQYLQPLTDPQHEVENWLQSNGFNLVATQDIRGVGFIYTYKK